MLSILKKQRRFHSNTSFARYSLVKTIPEVTTAILEGRPVVALESTIISHGMPYPRNLEMAREVEAIVRKHGAVPATVAIIDGVPKAGLTESDLMKLANSASGVVLKASTRDIAHACATGATAATTVASTMRLAHLAGISVFATGGIGGVHRGVESTMDISADLLELSRTPVTVVCAGIKSILDIEKSLEVLETNSVPVLSYGTSVFPAFYTNDSGIASPRSVNSTADIASMMGHQRLLRLDSGLLVAVPNPSPANGDKIQYAINFALTSAKNAGITGAKVTPYVLDKVQQLTGGESLESNIALVLNNARIAAEIAVDYANLLKQDENLRSQARPSFGHLVEGVQRPVERVFMTGASVGSTPAAVVAVAPTLSVAVASASVEAVVTPVVSFASTSPITSHSSSTSHLRPAGTPPEIVVVGGAVVDLIGHITTLTKFQTSNPGKLTISHGGVGRNIAESLARLGRKVSLATAVADDLNGRSIVDSGSGTGIDMSLVRVLSSQETTTAETEPRDAAKGNDKTVAAAATAAAATVKPRLPVHSTAIYNAIHDNHGDLCVGVADMSIFAQITPEYVLSLAPTLAASRLVAADGNLTKEAFSALVDLCAQRGVPVFFEPTSDHKCLLPFQAGRMHKIDILKPNVTELVHMVSHCLGAGMINSGRALVQNTLSTLAGDRIDQAGSLQQSMDLSDVRVLLNALYQVMNTSPSATTAAASAAATAPVKHSSFLGGLLGHEPKPVAAGARSVDASATAAAYAQSNARRAVSGKHIIVSLGARGLMWCGPARHLTATPAPGASTTPAPAPAYLKDGSCVVNEATQSATIFIPALAVNPADIVHTNGAGDALCAGLLAEIVRKAEAAVEGTGEVSTPAVLLPDMECIQKGLLSAHHWLVSLK